VFAVLQTHKFTSIIYPSPTAPFDGNSAVEFFVPLIVIVPGFTPPIVVPLGNATVSPCELMDASPMLIEFANTFTVPIHASLKYNAGEPILIVKSDCGIISLVTMPPNAPVGPVNPVGPV
jgi:hypothetical protein